MKNKYLPILLALLVFISLVACSNDNEVDEENSTEPLEDTEQEEIEEDKKEVAEDNSA